jgi:hypothetical protein
MRGAEVSPLIFSPGPGTPPNVHQVALRFRRLLTLSALPRFRLYDLRHTFATHLLAPPTPLDETNAPKAWRRSGAISKNVEPSDAEVAERIGSP